MAAIADAEGIDAPTRGNAVLDLGWKVQRAGDGLRGSAGVTPEMCVPGTRHLRVSILAVWADTLAGLLAVDVTRPRVPVTVELDVHLYAPPPGAGVIRGDARVVKLGRSVLVSSVDFSTGNGDAVGFAAASFVAAPDEAVQLQPGWNGIERHAGRGARLEVPFAERIGCESPCPGTTLLPSATDVLNAAGTINGGLIATAVEEAMLSLAPPGTTLSSLALRYLLAARIGPVVTTAELHNGLCRAEARDAGNGERLCVTATGRTFGS